MAQWEHGNDDKPKLQKLALQPYRKVLAGQGLQETVPDVIVEGWDASETAPQFILVLLA
jgi:hypothetical protein